MYMTAKEGVRQVPMLSGSVAGMLGRAPTDDFQTWLLQFRERVHLRPQDYKKLLLVARLHPFPASSPFIGNFPITIQGHNLLDVTLLASASYDELLDELGRISDRKLGREIEAERQLWAKTAKVIATLGGLGVFKRFLLKAALLDAKRLQTNPASLAHDFLKLGIEFANKAEKKLGADIVNSLLGSIASEAHLTNLGWHLARTALLLKKEDRAFKKAVDDYKKLEKKRQQAEKEFQRKQQK